MSERTERFTGRYRVVNLIGEGSEHHVAVILRDEADATALKLPFDDFLRCDYAPMIGDLLDMTYDVTTDGQWHDGSSRLVRIKIVRLSIVIN